MRRLALLVLAMLAGCTAETPPTVATNPAAKVIAAATLYRPDGAGPFPAVVVLHGCGGVDPHHHDWAKRLVKWGYVALVLDSFGPRGHGSQCALSVSPTPTTTRAVDAHNAARHLAGLAFVRADRIGVVGFSHGGGTVMETVQARTPAELQAMPFAAAVAFYPICSTRSQLDVGVPTLVLIGEQDDWTPAGRCRDVVAGLRRPDLLSMTVYPNAFHGFDRERAGVRYVQGARGQHRMERDPAAAEDALARTRAFFDQRLKS